MQKVTVAFKIISLPKRTQRSEMTSKKTRQSFLPTPPAKKRKENIFVFTTTAFEP
jgi:hypothetical protein